MADNSTATKPIGVTGLSYWRGLVSEEYLNQLKGTRAFKVYQEMADDCTIGALLDSIIMPLLSAEFFVEPASEDKADVEAAEFFESCRDDLNGYTWRQHVLDMMSALVYGFSLGEVVLKKRAGDKAQPGSHFEDGRVGIATIDPRAQTSLDRWQLDEQAHVTGFVQRDPNTGTYYEIPAEKLVHWAWRPEKRNPEGKSAMRSLYRSWYMRKNLELIEAIGIERDMAGMPVIKLPYGATEADSKVALAIVRNLRNDDEAGVVLPGPRRADKEAAGWELELLGGGGKQYNARETIRDYDKKILMRFFAQFLLLGMDKVGTQALVKGSQDFFALALKSIQQELLEVWNGQLIPYVFRFNSFSGLTGLPRLNWADPGKADIAGLTALLRDMTAAQIITASAELEDHVRSVAGLPDRPEGLGEEPRGAPAPAAGSGGLPFAKKPYGGEGSGNWGHEGRPGEIGGSAPGGGGDGGGLSLEAPRTFVERRKDIITTGKAKEVQKVRNEYLAEQGYSKEEIKRLDEMQNGWMRGVYNPQAQVMRQVATSEFGKDWPDDEYHDSAKVTDMMPSDRDIAIIQANRGFAVEAMRAKYGDEITVYRGVMGEQGAKIRETLGAGGEVDVGVNSLSSWSLHAKGADYFARNGGAILTAKVPVSEIWASADISTEFTIGEKEVVIGSRSGKQRVTEYTGKRKKKTRYAAIELVIVDDDPINANWIKAAAQEANNEPDDADVSYGGEGSGNWGHEGRPGEVGGSGEGGGGKESYRAPRRTSQQRMQAFAKAVGKQKYETALVMDADGKIITEADGTADKVHLPDEYAGQMQGMISVHNHPRGGSLSGGDLEFAAREGLGRMAAASDKYIYIIEPGPKGWGDSAKLKKSWAKTYHKEFQAQTGDWDTPQAYEAVSHSVMSTVAKRNGLKYQRLEVE